MIKISIDKLEYSGNVLAEKLQYSISKGDKIVISGPTGCGKSSFLKTLNLFNQNYEGSVIYNGKDVRDYPPSNLRREIIYLMQEPFLSDGKVHEILAEHLCYHCSKSLDYSHEFVMEVLPYLRLDKTILDSQIKKLSGGEKQRIALLQALLMKPEVLLLDEPSSALDRDTSIAIAEWISGMEDLTCIAISHDQIWQQKFARHWYFENRRLLEDKRGK